MKIKVIAYERGYWFLVWGLCIDWFIGYVSCVRNLGVEFNRKVKYRR